MALITISGFPCSGKTRRAEKIRTYLQDRLGDPSYSGPRLSVVIVSDDRLKLNRDLYDGLSLALPVRYHDKYLIACFLQIAVRKDLPGQPCSPLPNGK